jgi:competence protein ComEC
MGWGCDALLAVAHWVADWPGSVAVLPAPAGYALPLMAVGLLWLGLARGRWRWAGLAPMGLAIASAWTVARPDLLISPSGKLVAFQAPSGDLILTSNRAERLVRETWLRRNGQIRFDDIADLRGDETWLHCTAEHCDYGSPIKIRVVLGDVASKPEDCLGDALLIAPRSAERIDCPGGGALTHGDLLAQGAHALYVEGESVRIQDAATLIGNRPWLVRGRLGIGGDGANSPVSDAQ